VCDEAPVFTELQLHVQQQASLTTVRARQLLKDVQGGRLRQVAGAHQPLHKGVSVYGAPDWPCVGLLLILLLLSLLPTGWHGVAGEGRQ
jgi:hypothetical protein